MSEESSGQDNFGFWVPIEKGGIQETADGKRFVYGVASTEDLDLDQEVMDASGLKKSLDYFLKNGRIDYDHQSKKEPKFIIGEPRDGKIDAQNKFHLKAELYKGLEIADQCWKLLKAGSTRLGWSVGGSVLKKSVQFDKSLQKFVPKITEVLINHIALTPHPKNTNTFATANAYGAFIKSLARPETSLGTLVKLGGNDYLVVRPDELEKAISTASGGSPTGLNPVIPQSLEGDIKVFKSYVLSEDFQSDPDATKRWFKNQGLGDVVAEGFAAYIEKNADKIASVKNK